MSNDCCSFPSTTYCTKPCCSKAGPNTEHGKYVVSMNALQHGLRTDRLLPCKRNCYYKDACHLYEELYLEGCNESPGVCAIEAGLYLSLMQRFNKSSLYKGIDVTLLETYAMNEILLRRSSNFLAKNPDMKSWAAIYHSRLQNRQVKLLKQISEARSVTSDILQ